MLLTSILSQKTVALILAAAATMAVAMCPNQCSGHGACTSDDQCRCWKGYSGFDCSKRSCPVVESWAVDNAENPHAYQECAGKGICDTSTGACECFAGYEGRGCERSACPNACSGHGKCRMLADLDTYAAGRAVASGWTALSWDEKSILTCECDGGYMGADCSQRICPHGDDPMTVCEQGNTEQVQQVVFKMPGNFVSGSSQFMGEVTPDLSAGFVQEAGSMAMRFKSYANEVFYTAAIADPFAKTVVAADISTNFEEALEGVPNFRVRNVDVDDAVVDATTGTEVTSTFAVTFRHEGMNDNSYGEQNLLQCPHTRTVEGGVDTFGCSAEGCSPQIAQPRATLVAIQASADLTAATALTPGDPTKAAFTADSVLTCPIGATCGTSTATTHQGAIALYLEPTGFVDNYKIFAKGFGNTAVDVAVVPGLVNTFTYIGRFSDYATAPLTGKSATIDLSAIMPNTRYTLAHDAAGTWATGVNQLIFHWFTTAECQSVTDITTGVESFNNLDVENIECSGRGECDRGTGVCACFDGYTGLACGEQTILI